MQQRLLHKILQTYASNDYTEKQWKAVQCYEKPVKNYCMFDISCLNDSDRLKSAVMFCFYKPFTVNNSTLLVLYSTLYSTWLFELTSKLNGFVFSLEIFGIFMIFLIFLNI